MKPHEAPQSRQWLALDANCLSSPLALKLLDRFGPAGALAWIGFLCACKRSAVPGRISFSSEAEAVALLGLTGVPLVDNRGEKWDLETFWRVLGQHKQTKRTRRGHVVNITSTHWGHWQDDERRAKERRKKARQRAQNEGDTEGTSGGQAGDVSPQMSPPTYDLRPTTLPPPPSSNGAGGHPPPAGLPRGGRGSTSPNDDDLPPVVADAVAVLAAARLAAAQADAAAGRRPAVAHPAGWLAACQHDLAANAGAELAQLAEAGGISDPAALAAAWQQPAAGGGGCGDLPEVSRCADCAELTFDCVCR